MSVDKLTDEQRRARRLSIEQITEKIKVEYGDALALLGMLPLVERVSTYTVEDHVAHAKSRGIELSAEALHIQREWLTVIGSASIGELGVVTRVLSLLLDYDRTDRASYMNLVNEIIAVLSHAEVMLELRKRDEAE